MEVKFTKRIGSFIPGSSRQWSERVGGGTWKSANLVSIRRSMERSMDVRNGVWNGIVNSQPVLALICFQVVIIPDLILLVRIFDKSGDIANLNEMVGDKFESGSPVAVPAVANPPPWDRVVQDGQAEIMELVTSRVWFSWLLCKWPLSKNIARIANAVQCHS